MGYKATTVSRVSDITGKTGEMILPLTKEEIAEGLKRHQSGALIQTAFPTLNAEQREFILTGITPAEWAKIYPEEGP